MGNERSCSCIGNGDEYEIITRDDAYKFKRSVIFLLYFYIQLLPTSRRDQMFYGKDDEYDNIKGKIVNKTSLVRHDEKPYTNGNVKVYIPTGMI